MCVLACKKHEQEHTEHVMADESEMYATTPKNNRMDECFVDESAIQFPNSKDYILLKSHQSATLIHREGIVILNGYRTSIKFNVHKRTLIVFHSFGQCQKFVIAIAYVCAAGSVSPKYINTS